MKGAKTIIVTGGSRGIGKAIAEKLLTDGYAVMLCAENKEELKKTQQELSKIGPVSSAVVDLSDRDSVTSFIESWNAPIYGLVNNAGIVKTERLDEKDSGSWDDILAVNLNGLYYLTKGLIGQLVDDGRIINISSQLGKEGRAGYSAYCASKFAVIGITKCWAKELGERGITVNAVCPGWVETDMGMKDLERLAEEKGKSSKELYKEISEPLELKRFTKPEEVANLVSFLISKEASGITGRDMLLNTIWNQE